MQTLTDTYRAPCLADARAAALQAIDTMHEDGFAATTIEARREDGQTVIHVTYQREDA